MLGVFEEEKVREGLGTGEFIATDLGWMEGMANWRPLAELDDFRAPSSSVVPPPSPAVAPASSAPVVVARTEPFAIWSFVLSLVGLLCCAFVFGIPAIVCGHLALGNLKRNPALQGRGLALAGLIIGYASVALLLIYIVFFGGMAFLQEIMKKSSN